MAKENRSTLPVALVALTGEVPSGLASAQRNRWDVDAKLIQTAAQGNDDAQRELLRQAVPVVRRTVRYLMGSSQDGEDAVQASLLAILNSAARFQGRSALGTWVTKIATRTTLRLAQKQRSLVPTELLEEQWEPPNADTRAEDVPRRVWLYLERLPDAQRIAIGLRYGLDYSVHDIADATNSSPNTVKYRLKEALAKIRHMVRQDLALRGKAP